MLEYPTEQWGKKTAEKYLDDLEAGLERIRPRPDLLQPLPDLHPSLTFYRVNKHLFACDRQPESIIVLTVIHGRMDIPNRLVMPGSIARHCYVPFSGSVYRLARSCTQPKISPKIGLTSLV